jgi:hypothetical protein
MATIAATITAAAVMVAGIPAASAHTGPPPDSVPVAGVVAHQGSAAYPPCSTITWAYDRADEPEDSRTLATDIAAAFVILGGHTGLTFMQAEPATAPDIKFDWGSLDGHEPGAQAAAWRSGVTFAIGSEMTRDRWAGFKRRAVPAGDGSHDIGDGRGWLVVHEVMHALGFGHSTELESVMAPTASITNVEMGPELGIVLRSGRKPGFSARDLAGFAALYPRTGCTAP